MLAIRMKVTSEQQQQQQHYLNHLSYSYHPGSNGRERIGTVYASSTQQQQQQHQLTPQTSAAAQQSMQQHGHNEQLGADRESAPRLDTEPEQQVRRRAKRRHQHHHHPHQHHRAQQRLREGAGEGKTYDGGTESDTSTCSEQDDTAPSATPLSIGDRLRYDQHSICDMFGF